MKGKEDVDRPALRSQKGGGDWGTSTSAARTKTNIYMMMKVQMKGRRVSLDPRARGESRGDSDQWSDEKGLHTKQFFAT